MGNKPSKTDPMSRGGSVCLYKLVEDVTCSVCLDEFSDPVSITCGHTFCRGCITKYWHSPDLLDYRCPVCRKICPKERLISVHREENMVVKVQLPDKKEQSRQIPPSPLQLVFTDSDGRLQLDQSVVQRCFLDGGVSEYPVCLICVIGEKRKGKTTLLNYILRALNCLEGHQPVSLGQIDEPLTGFEWRSGVDSVTKGIWIWSKPFILERNGEKLAVFVLDTEGSLDIESDRETCVKLSALSMLLSSYLIFNVSTGLKSTELDYLEMYLHVSELMGASFSLQSLQHLDVLVRDWQGHQNYGREAACDYLQLECQKLKVRKASVYNRLLGILRSPSVSGFLLPYPGKEFLGSSEGKLADMDEDFRYYLTKYISDLVERIWLHHKTDISGEKITGGHMGKVLKDFVILLQRKLFSFASPLQMSQCLEHLRHMKPILQSFQDFLDKELPTNPSFFKVLGITPSKMRIKVSEQLDIHLALYVSSLEGDDAVEKEKLKDEMNTLLTGKLECFCAQYSLLFSKYAIAISCAVGGGVLSLAGGIAGAAVAGTVIAAEAVGVLGSTSVAAIGGAVGSVALGAVGTGAGASIGVIIGQERKKKDTKVERKTEETYTKVGCNTKETSTKAGRNTKDTSTKIKCNTEETSTEEKQELLANQEQLDNQD